MPIAVTLTDLILMILATGRHGLLESIAIARRIYALAR